MLGLHFQETLMTLISLNPKDFRITLLRFLEMPWPIWWTSCKPLRLAMLKLLWCWSLNRRQVWKSESTSSNWHCTWISHLLIVWLHFEGLKAILRMISTFWQMHTSLDIFGWNPEMCGVRPQPVSKAMEPFGVLQDQCLDCMFKIVFDCFRCSGA